MRAFVRVVFVALALIARPALAHPIHSTLTRLEVDPSGRTLTLTVRAFADDFSAVVARFAGRLPPRDSSTVPAEVARYVNAQFTIAAATGGSLPLVPCGTTRAGEAYLLCFRVILPIDAHGARISNRLLTELHADQVNIVQFEAGALRRSFLFTKGSAASTLP